MSQRCGQRLGHEGLWESLWAIMILHVGRFELGLPQHDLVFSLLLPLAGVQGCLSSILWVKEFCVTVRPNAAGSGRAGVSPHRDPWCSGPRQTSPFLGVILRLCVSLASEAP